jgi:hypothetical protein
MAEPEVFGAVASRTAVAGFDLMHDKVLVISVEVTGPQPSFSDRSDQFVTAALLVLPELPEEDLALSAAVPDCRMNPCTIGSFV